jgi:hypothetical protein
MSTNETMPPVHGFNGNGSYEGPSEDTLAYMGGYVAEKVLKRTPTPEEMKFAIACYALGELTAGIQTIESLIVNRVTLIKPLVVDGELDGFETFPVEDVGETPGNACLSVVTGTEEIMNLLFARAVTRAKK